MIKLVRVQFAMTDGQIAALATIKRAQVKGWGWPDDIPNDVAGALIGLGLICHQGDITTAGELVITSTGFDSVVTQ